MLLKDFLLKICVYDRLYAAARKNTPRYFVKIILVKFDLFNQQSPTVTLRTKDQVP